MASPCASLTGGDSTLVRDFQPVNWSNDRTSRRLVRHLVDDLKRRPFLEKPVSIPELINAITTSSRVPSVSRFSLTGYHKATLG
jgi:hypothetical protein